MNPESRQLSANETLNTKENLKHNRKKRISTWLATTRTLLTQELVADSLALDGSKAPTALHHPEVARHRAAQQTMDRSAAAKIPWRRFAVAIFRRPESRRPLTVEAPDLLPTNKPTMRLDGAVGFRTRTWGKRRRCSVNGRPTTKPTSPVLRRHGFWTEMLVKYYYGQEASVLGDSTGTTDFYSAGLLIQNCHRDSQSHISKARESHGYFFLKVLKTLSFLYSLIYSITFFG
jgi:hypothetical protein